MATLRLTHRTSPLQAVTGLNFPSNNTAGGDIRLVWAGADILPRLSHTAIWKARYVQHTGYYAVIWHATNDGEFYGSYHDFGTHPYPCDGTKDANGQRLVGTGSSGTVHYHEIAGLNRKDFISSPGGSVYLEEKAGAFMTAARTCEVVGGTTIRHRYWPNVANPTQFIQQDVAVSTYNADPDAVSPPSPAFMIGASPWTATGTANSECPSGVIRGIKLFDAALSIADIASEAASGVNTPQTAAGIASVWYMNENPTPSDVSDKSGAGHSPVWDNANRPSLYEG